MNYYIFKLQFTAPAHFGASVSAVSLSGSEMTFCADRLFSALCQAAVQRWADGPQRLCAMAREGQLKLSDAFPWKEGVFYLPRPCLESTAVRSTDASDRKVMKKVTYLPLTRYAAYLRALAGGEPVDPKTLLVRFGEETLTTRAVVFDGQDTLPYAVGEYRFDDGCGLYFMAGLEDRSDLSMLKEYVAAVGHGGLGGKVSSGCGSFISTAIPVEEIGEQQDKALTQMLTSDNADCWISLTTSLPRDDELEKALDGALFQLTRRAGFVQTSRLSGPSKKREQFFLTAGSTFHNVYTGDVYDVAPDRCPHPVYRYAMPVFLGVSECIRV